VQENDMDEATRANLARSLLLTLIDDDHVRGNTLVVVREIQQWPDGESRVWIVVNWPN
jgi:hypothetical protein